LLWVCSESTLTMNERSKRAKLAVYLTPRARICHWLQRVCGSYGFLRVLVVKYSLHLACVASLLLPAARAKLHVYWTTSASICLSLQRRCGFLACCRCPVFARVGLRCFVVAALKSGQIERVLDNEHKNMSSAPTRVWIGWGPSWRSVVQYSLDLARVASLLLHSARAKLNVLYLTRSTSICHWLQHGVDRMVSYLWSLSNIRSVRFALLHCCYALSFLRPAEFDFIAGSSSVVAGVCQRRKRCALLLWRVPLIRHPLPKTNFPVSGC